MLLVLDNSLLTKPLKHPTVHLLPQVNQGAMDELLDTRQYTTSEVLTMSPETPNPHSSVVL